MTPTVTVIIPTHNRSALLERAIGSVLRQTFTDLEVIVVDDASTDATREAVSRVSDPRLSYVRHPANLHVSAARNTGVARARGRYVAFLDDDDEWLPEKLERQVEVIERSSPRVAGVYTGALSLHRTDGSAGYTIRPAFRGDILAELLKDNCIGPTSTVLLRRECLDDVGPFDVTLKYGEDYDLWIRLASRYDFECIPEPLVRYTPGADGLSSDYRVVIEGIETLLRRYRDLFARHPATHSERHLVVGVLYCYEGDFAAGRRSLVQAIRLDPGDWRPYLNFALSWLGARWFRRLKTISGRVRGPMLGVSAPANV